MAKWSLWHPGWGARELGVSNRTILGNSHFELLSRVPVTWVWARVGQRLWTTCDAGRRPVSRYRDIARSSDRNTAGGRPFLTSPRCHRSKHSLETVAPAVLVHERFVDKSTPKRCVYHPRVVHSWLQDQGWTRWPLDLPHFQLAGLIVPGAVEKRDGPRRFTR